MDLPRIASQTSICQSNIQLLTDYKPRTPVSKRLLNAQPSNQEPQFAVLPSSSTSFQPSRKREEARALQNLRRRVQAVKIVQANQQESIESSSSSNCNNKNLTDPQLDNRPHLLQKVSLQTCFETFK